MCVVDTSVDDADGGAGPIELPSAGRRTVPQRLIYSHGGVCVIVQDLRLPGLVDIRDMARSRDCGKVGSRKAQCETIERHAQPLFDREPDTLRRQRRQKHVLLLRDRCLRYVRGHGVQPPFRSRILDSADQRKTLHADDDVL